METRPSGTELHGDLQLISCGKTLTKPLRIDLPDATVVFFSTSASTKKRKNQDSAAVLPLTNGSCVLAVSDGAGGHKGGRAASKKAIETLVATLRVDDTSSDRSSIITGFELANEAVCKGKSGALCTLAVAHVEDGCLRSFHAGDSLVMTVHADASIVSYTPPHSTVGYGVEAGLLSEEEALEHEERHLLVNALGTEDYRIEIGAPYQLNKGDTLLVASDGVVTFVTPETLAELLCVEDLEQAARDLIHACSSKEDGEVFDDDLTFILYRQKV